MLDPGPRATFPVRKSQGRGELEIGNIKTPLHPGGAHGSLRQALATLARDRSLSMKMTWDDATVVVGISSDVPLSYLDHPTKLLYVPLVKIHH